MLVNLTEKEKQYSHKKSKEVGEIVERLSRNNTRRLEKIVGFELVDLDNNFKLLLDPEYGFGHGAVLNLVKVSNKLKK